MTKPLILVVDDDADIRQIVIVSLAALGCDFTEASSGEEALRIMSQMEPDAVVLDLMMPGIDGNEVCKRIRATEAGRLIPILMLTAQDSMKKRVQSLTDGVDDYLTKPFNHEELCARIKALLRVRMLHLELNEKNRELIALQQTMLDKERQVVVGQLAGTAAHQLGQPLSALMLNTHLLEVLPKEDARFAGALAAVRSDLTRMKELIQQLKEVNPKVTEKYFEGVSILTVGDKSDKKV